MTRDPSIYEIWLSTDFKFKSISEDFEPKQKFIIWDNTVKYQIGLGLDPIRVLELKFLVENYTVLKFSQLKSVRWVGNTDSKYTFITSVNRRSST